jgi:2-haloacid dehalogenase
MNRIISTAAPLRRRRLLQLAAGAAAAGASVTAPARAAGRVKAIAFDGFVIFDPRPVFQLAETLFPGKGAELSNAWRVRQFEYTWLRTLNGRYVDFWQATQEALVFAAKLLRLELTADKRDQLMQAFLQLKAHADVPPVLATLRAAGIRLAFLSNMSGRMLEAATRSAGLDGNFEHLLSTDLVQAYKPDPRAYRMAMDAFGLRREEIVFAAFGGWDAAGAKSFGYATFWNNRLGLPLEELGVTPDAVGATAADLVSFVATAAAKAG